MPDSKSGGSNTVWVRLPPSAPNTKEHLSGALLCLQVDDEESNPKLGAASGGRSQAKEA